MTRTDILLLDFDGTVAVGTGPVLAYARAAAETLPYAAAAELLASVAKALDEVTEPGGVGPLDGYDLVRGLALRAGVGPAELQRAYALSRERLGTAAAPVRAPDGLVELLAEVRTEVQVVLATNAPATRLEAALEQLALTPHLDRVVTSVGKPEGLDALLDELGAAPTGPARVLSVGDVWANDLAPVHRRGHPTLLVGPTVPAGATPTAHATELPELYPLIVSWSQGPDDLTPGPALLPLPTRTEGAR